MENNITSGGEYSPLITFLMKKISKKQTKRRSNVVSNNQKLNTSSINKISKNRSPILKQSPRPRAIKFGKRVNLEQLFYKHSKVTYSSSTTIVSSQQKDINLECEERLKKSAATFHSTPIQVGQRLVIGQSLLSPSLNESEHAKITQLISSSNEEEVVVEQQEGNEEERNAEMIPDETGETQEEEDEISLSQDCVESQVASLSLEMEEEGEGQPESNCPFTQQVLLGFESFNDYMQKETLNCPTADYLSNHPTVTVQNRRVLIDWLSYANSELQVSNDVLYHAITLFDRSLHQFRMDQYYQIDKGNLQALGAACLFIATKYFGKTIRLSDLLPQAGDQMQEYATKEDILKIESWVLNSLDFQLRSVLTIDYINLFTHILMNDLGFNHAFPSLTSSREFIRTLNLVSSYLCEVQLHNYQILQFRPSLIALSCLLLSFQMMNVNYKAIPIVRKIIKEYMNNLLTIKSQRVKVYELNTCMENCLNSIKDFEISNQLNVVNRKPTLYTFEKYHTSGVAVYVNHTIELMKLSNVELERW